MPNFNTAYEVSFIFQFDFFAADDATADALADSIVNQIFDTIAFTTVERTTGAGSAVALTGQDIVGFNYTYQYTYHVPVGDAPSTYHNVQADDALKALAAINQTGARIVGITNFPVKVDALKQE